jgi:hypothetical protein
MKRATFYASVAQAAEGIGQAFLEGLHRHGWQTEIALVGRVVDPGDMLVQWATRRREMVEPQRARGRDVCILERGYIGDRFHWTSVSFGGDLNGRAEFRGVRDDPARLDQFFPGVMQPWRADAVGGYALLIGQVPGDMALRSVHGSLTRWYDDTTWALRQRGYEVYYRPHPRAALRLRREAPTPIFARRLDGCSLEEAFAGARVVVTFSSNTAVEAVLAGIPAVACDRVSMAWDVTSHSVEDPLVRPDRSSWAARLAWKQWSPEEMASGECWAAISN